MRILLFSEITLFKYNVSTILSPIVAKEYMMAKLTEKCENYLISSLYPRTQLSVLFSPFNSDDGFEGKGNC